MVLRLLNIFTLLSVVSGFGCVSPHNSLLRCSWRPAIHLATMKLDVAPQVIQAFPTAPEQNEVLLPLLALVVCSPSLPTFLAAQFNRDVYAAHVLSAMMTSPYHVWLLSRFWAS